MRVVDRRDRASQNELFATSVANLIPPPNDASGTTGRRRDSDLDWVKSVESATFAELPSSDFRESLAANRT